MPSTRKGLASSLPEHLLPSAEEPRQHPGEVQVPPVQSCLYGLRGSVLGASNPGPELLPTVVDAVDMTVGDTDTESLATVEDAHPTSPSMVEGEMGRQCSKVIIPILLRIC